MRLRKRLGTGILAVLMVVSSLQLPGGLSYAAELPADSMEAGQEIQEQDETVEGMTTDSSQDLPDEETGWLENGSETDHKADEEDDETDENGVTDDAMDSEDEETVFGDQVSGNDAGVLEPDAADIFDEDVVEISDEDMAEILIEDELEGVYQFGGAPSEQGHVSAMSVSTYDAGAETYLYQQLKSRQGTIDVSSYNLDADGLNSLVSGVLNEHPDLYFVGKNYSYSLSGTRITQVRFTLDNTLDDDAVRRAVDEALEAVDAGMSDLEKAIVLHDYLVVNCEYDKENLDAGFVPNESYTIYGVFAKRTAVCEGYALAYKYLLSQVGIDCYMVNSSDMNHVWNMIVLDGKKYQVDVTWDDPAWDQVGRAMHTYMFRSDAAFEGHNGWQVTSGSDVVNYTATDTKYDSAFWTECRSPLVITGDDCYYVSSGKEIRRTSLSDGVDVTDAGTLVQRIGTWPVWEGSGFYSGAFSGLFLEDGRLYYNDTSFIYSIALDGTDRCIEFIADTSAGYIYGCSFFQWKIVYSLHQTPYLSAKEEVLEASSAVSVHDGTPDAANPETEYTALDGTKISSTANGQPKLLLFYENGSENCQTTIKSISDNIYKFYGVDIYAVEVDKNTKDSVSQFREAFGCDDIVFSYSTDSSNEDSMWEYLTLIGFSGLSRPTPVICYIDAENCVRYITTLSVPTADTVLSNLRTYCGYSYQPQQRYTITYVLDGGTNHEDNPSAYTAGIEDIILKDASREGYRFDGWYEDASYQGKVTRIPKAYTGNITLYAKWIAVSIEDLPRIDITPAEGNLVVRFQGEYDTAGVQEILDKLNKIRKDAYEQGKVNSYEELKWSADLEAIARLRAVETSINNDTGTRPNGEDYRSVVTTDNKVSVSTERLGYSRDGLLAEIDKDGSGAFLENIANQEYHFVGVGAFRLDNGTGPSDGLYRVIIAFSDKKDLDQNKDSRKGKGEQDIEMKPTAVKKLQFASEPAEIKKGDTCQLPLTLTVAGKDAYSRATEYTGIHQSGGTWSSSDETVATVDSNGVVTGLSAGKTTITVRIGTKKASTEVYVQSEFGRDMEVTLKNSRCTYNGWEQQPKVVVSVSDTVLQEGQDYELSYENNINVGYATVTVKGIRYYYGSFSRSFQIKPAQLIIRAKDKTILTKSRIPTASQYEYEADGLCADDKLFQNPTFSCGIVSSAKAGQYEIVPSGADAGANYEITYENGRLRVADEYVSHTVCFDTKGHGESVADYFDVRTGATIDKPKDPSAKGYRFGGWFRDAACTKEWNFDTDIVQSDMTLYACWLDTGSNGSFALQEIGDVYYTGKACKPAVKVYDGDTLLKAGRDYQIKYYNNIDAMAGKIGNGQGYYFIETLPYVEVIGKGDYTESVKVNFNILPVSIGDGGEKASAGVVLKVPDQLVKSKKNQKPFQSIKYTKAMQEDKDFTLSLKAVNACDESGKVLSNTKLEDAVIPAGYEGEFQLVVQGTGNYEGSISRTVLVKDKTHLIKNAKITLGKNLKNMTYADEIKLTPSVENANDTFTVKCGGVLLRPGIDYTVKYDRHPKPGKAELTIIGANAYAGSKTVTFTVKGNTFSAKTVEVDDVENKVYTGRAQTQNGVILTYGKGSDAERKLIYGTDYTISYSKNVNKGTATMIFKGIDTAGFSGSFKKNFKITAADISEAGQVSCKMQSTTFSYCKAGVKPADEIVLTNHEGFVLRNGKDYTLTYTNNKEVTNASGANPTIIIKGKGNYTGQLEKGFSISKAKLAIDNVKASSVAYKSGRADTYSYTPSIKVMDGKSALRVGKDYEIRYENNTQADYESYMAAMPAANNAPQAVITVPEDSNYRITAPIVVPLPIYWNKLTKSNLEVDIGTAMYTGVQVTPVVRVYYKDKNGEKIRLWEGTDYSLTYGANVKSGKNKGTVRISGIAPDYGGDVTVKFEIEKKPISGKALN